MDDANTLANRRQRQQLVDLFYSNGFVPSNTAPDGDYDWADFGKLAFSDQALQQYERMLQRIPRFMDPEFEGQRPANEPKGIIRHFFMLHGIFAARLSLDGRWDWDAFDQLEFNPDKSQEYQQFVRDKVPGIMCPLVPTKKERAALQAYVDHCAQSFRPGEKFDCTFEWRKLNHAVASGTALN